MAKTKQRYPTAEDVWADPRSAVIFADAKGRGPGYHGMKEFDRHHPRTVQIVRNQLQRMDEQSRAIKRDKPSPVEVSKPMALTLKQMQTFLNHGWGDFGETIFATWGEFNAKYFGDKLKPIAIVPSPVMPYGHCVGLTFGTDRMTLASGNVLRADKGVLLHEMIHQHLFQIGENPRHAGQPWCDCIMRLHKQITKQDIHAAPDKVGKREGSVSFRYKPTCEATGKESLTQKDIAHWPHSTKLDLGPLAPRRDKKAKEKMK